MLALQKYNIKSGFTLIEVLLSLALVSLIAGILVPAYHLLQARNDIDMATTIISQTLYRAQTLSRSVAGDSAWGVYVEQGRVVLFSGASYVTRDETFDEEFRISPALSLSGLQEFTYEKFSGLPLSSGTTTLTLNEYELRSITVNTMGTIQLSKNVSEDSPGEPGESPEQPPVQNVAYSYAITSDWGTGFCADIEVTTEIEEPVVWEIEIDLSSYPLNGEPYNVWNADWAYSNEVMTASGVPFNNEVSADSPQEFGFCANRPAAPISEVDYSIDITSDWGTGYCANVTITTDATEPITWEVTIPLTTAPINGIPYNVWNADWEYSNGSMTASGVGWNSEVSASQSREFGYCANR